MFFNLVMPGIQLFLLLAKHSLLARKWQPLTSPNS